jgi:hypothetical protein
MIKRRFFQNFKILKKLANFERTGFERKFSIFKKRHSKERSK